MIHNYIRSFVRDVSQQSFFHRFAILFIVLFGTYYIPIEGDNGLGIVHVTMMTVSVLLLFLVSKAKTSKALIFGSLYLLIQLVSVLHQPEGFRASTFFYSFGLVGMYISMYYLIYEIKVFDIHSFIRIVVFMIRLYFVVCIIQQLCLVVGISYLPALNICKVLGRGLGCNSLALEPSHFARFMLVFYYAYVKCNEYLRGEGPFTLKELFSSEHRQITIPFLWMMLTMGSGTAFICLMIFSFYFITRNSFYYLIPFVIIVYFFVLPLIPNESLQRAITTSEATASFSADVVKKADGSAAVRIAPLLNSFKVDLTDIDTWLGRGIDSGVRSGLSHYDVTLFDDYGLLTYLASLLLAFVCAYRFNSLGVLFLFAGVGGGCYGNIHYTWYLAIIMTFVRYFYENKNNLASSGTSEDKDKTFIVID